MNVDHFMTHDVRSCRAVDNLLDAAMIMWNRDCGFVPVTDEPDGRLTGVITDRDICMAVATQRRPIEAISVGEVMNHDPVKCAPTDDVRVALERMSTSQVRRIPIVDKKGRVKGILALNDLILASEEGEARKRAAVPYGEVMGALKAVSAHRVPAAVAS